MICMACQGEGWRRRLVPHPGVPGCMVWVTRLCMFCQGKGKVKEILAPSGKDKAANGTEEKELSLSS